MSPNANQTFGKNVTELVKEFGSGVERLKDKTFAAPQALEYEGRNFTACIVLRDDRDLIFQFFMKSFPKDFPSLLTAVVAAHFGSSERFALDWVPEVKSYALLGKGLWDNALRDELFLTAKFLELVDTTLDELRPRA